MTFNNFRAPARVAACGLALLWPAAAQATVITTTSHPGAIHYDFNDGKAPFEAFTIPGGVASGARFTGDGGGLKISNAFAGSFSINTKLAAFDADQLSHIFFDYKLGADVKVNFFFRVNGKFHGVTFSGPDTVRPGAILIGKIPGVKADGAWHRAHIPLRDWLRQVDPVTPRLDVDMVLIGNWDNSGWLMAGMGGNGPGATWWMDNFSVLGAGPGEAKLKCVGATKWLLDGAPAGEGDALITSPAEGYHLAEAQSGGKTIAYYPLFTAPNGPKIGVPRLTGNLLRVPVLAAGGLRTQDVKLTVDGKTFSANSLAMTWNGTAQELQLNAAHAGFKWADGAAIALAVDNVRDLQGRALPDWKGEAKVAFADWKGAVNRPGVQIEGLPAPRPRLTLRDQDGPQPTVPAPLFGPGDGSFEEDMDEWMVTSPDTDAILERDATTAVSGKYSLRLTCPQNASRFWATIRTSGFDAAKTPIISFDYKATPQLRVDFMVLFEGRTYSIQFTDKDNPAGRLGSIPDVIADGKWHHTEFNLGSYLREAMPGRESYRIDSVYIGDGGWMGNARNVQYWFDNFQFVPQVKSPAKAIVALEDVSGMKGLAWLLDEKPDSEPPVTANGSAEIELKGAGRRWLHVRVQNGAGQWSPTQHTALLLTEPAPLVARGDAKPNQ